MEQTSSAPALEFAGFWRRLAAYLIDILILSAISSMIFPGKWLINWSDFNPGNWILLPVMIAGNFMTLITDVAYHAGFWTWRGQTPGKMLLNIKVIRTDGTNITLGYSLLRYLGYIVSSLMLGIGFLWIAFDPRKQGIHDKIADTCVVILPETPRTQRALSSNSNSTG
jgi:uncharacterized RDD family membrane protein YckC